LEQDRITEAVLDDEKKPDTPFDPEKIIKDFPILDRRIRSKRLVYLDNAATTQKPQSVIRALENYYSKTNANVHRGLHTLAEEATAAFEQTRKKIADFIGGVKAEEIIYTGNATEAINLVAHSWGRRNINKGDRIVLTEMEHHANLVPWIVLARENGAELEYIPIDDEGLLDLADLDRIISPNTKMVAITQMSNVLGTINPVDKIARFAHDNGSLVLLDGAQSVPHLPVDVRAIDADFLAFSAHKMLGPTGIGVLYGRESILNDMEPFLYGGEMINEVRYDYADWAPPPHKFEAGTPNIAGAIGFSPALDYLDQIGMNKLRQHEMELTSYTLDRLSELNHIKIFGPRIIEHRGGAISFIDDTIHPHDLATFLDSQGIAIRAGHHCAQPLMKRLGVVATARASLYIYNTKNDIDGLIDALTAARRYFTHER
jgi:cysteine desulfurase/selenocysteine lyase